MDTIDSTTRGPVDPRELWTTARLTFLVTLFIGLLSLLIDRFLRDQSVTQQSLPLAFVRCALPIVWAAIASMVLAGRRNDISGTCSTVAQSSVAAWVLATTVMSVVVARAAGPTDGWIPLAITIAVWCTLTIISLFLVSALASAGHLRDAATGLVLSGLTGWLGLVWVDQSALANVIVRICGGVLTVMVVFFMYARRRLRLEWEPDQNLSLKSMSVLSIPLLLGAACVPFGLARLEQIRLVESVETTRLPLFAVVAFLLLTPMPTIGGETDALRYVVSSRRLTTVSAFVAVCAFAVFLIQSPLADSHGLTALSVGSVAVSFVVALLLPWTTLHVQRRAFSASEVIALCIAIVVPLLVAPSAGAWLSVSLAVVVILLIVTTTRHIARAQPLLASVRNQSTRSPPTRRNSAPQS